MLTYELEKRPGCPLYDSLYRCIREDILSGRLAPGTQLPSKRALASNLKVSIITVEGAYSQLLDEGFLSTKERVGYFVEAVLPAGHSKPQAREVSPAEDKDFDGVDLTANGSADFPFSVWSRLQREVMQDYGHTLLAPLPNLGYVELRRAIARHLSDFRGLQVTEEQILVGAGTDFLYNLLIQLLGRDLLYAVENPGYDKIRKIYSAGGARWICAPMDEKGVDPERLGEAQVLHLSPAHHFPTGIVTPMDRRLAQLSWVAEQENRYLIEDDFDSEFRFRSKPLPALMSLDRTGRVIYMNTFSKSLAPSIRISYLVLPVELMERFRQTLGFYSCTVPSFEQFTLARFLSRGYFEKHINRMRRFYRLRREETVALLKACPYADRLTISERDAGLHFLVKVKSSLNDGQLVEWLAKRGIKAATLSSFYQGEVPPGDYGYVLVNYSGLTEESLKRLKAALK